MSIEATAFAKAKTAGLPWFKKFLAMWIKPWLKIKTDPEKPAALAAADVPVCYVLERRGFSNVLILEEACREAGLPTPVQPLPAAIGGRLPSMLYLWRRRRFGFSKAGGRIDLAHLDDCLRAAKANPDFDLQLLPVSIFVGRSPHRATGWFRVLFSENWIIVGRFRRLLSILLNGRDTIVQFSQPIRLRSLVDDQADSVRASRKLARVFRVHFRRIRTAIVGPDLSHRRTLIDSVIHSEAVRQAMAGVANKEKISPQQAAKRAREYAWEIAADYSHSVVRSVTTLLVPFWNKIYDGVVMRHFDSLKRVAPGHEVIYVPCHRSHIDYLLLSYQLYMNGIVPPHIAAGINLNLPIVGPLLRRGGAFFIRRTFKANALYSAVFGEYVMQLFMHGVSMEYFIEGGRSRTGRLLEPKAGILSMTVRNFLRESRQPVVFQPVYIGYEKLIEGRTYIRELSGKPKERESLLGLLRSFGVLRNKYGKVSLSFGEPIFLGELLDRRIPQWRQSADHGERPEWFASAVAQLAKQILVNINRAADVNPINLLAVCLLTAPKHAIGLQDLKASLQLTKALLTELPYSDRVTVTELSPDEIVAYGEKLGWIKRVAHPLGDVVITEGQRAVMLSYFRNNVLHLFATSAWVAGCFLNNRRLSRSAVVRLGEFVYPFLQSELFLPWSTDDFGRQVEATIDFFVRQGLLKTDVEGKIVRRRVGQTDQAFQLRLIAQISLQTFERYYIAVALLVRNGPSALATTELENLCHLTAQRLSLLYERNAPEFFDRNLFRGFINTLKEHKFVWLDAAGKLAFDERLGEIAKDAKMILSRELRHSILKLTGDTTNP